MIRIFRIKNYCNLIMCPNNTSGLSKDSIEVMKLGESNTFCMKLR